MKSKTNHRISTFTNGIELSDIEKNFSSGYLGISLKFESKWSWKDYDVSFVIKKMYEPEFDKFVDEFKTLVIYKIDVEKVDNVLTELIISTNDGDKTLKLCDD